LGSASVAAVVAAISTDRTLNRMKHHLFIEKAPRSSHHLLTPSSAAPSTKEAILICYPVRQRKSRSFPLYRFQRLGRRVAHAFVAVVGRPRQLWHSVPGLRAELAQVEGGLTSGPRMRGAQRLTQHADRLLDGDSAGAVQDPSRHTANVRILVLQVLFDVRKRV